MLKKILVLLLFTLAISGCTTNKDRLSTPTNVRYEDYTLFFDSVEHAESYIIDFGNYYAQVEENFYEFFEFGDYQVRVKAKASGYQDSYYSDVINISVLNDLSAPANLNYVDGILFWDLVPGAKYYEIYVDSQLYTTSDTSKILPLYGTIRREIKIRAYFILGRSEFSPSIFASGELTILSSTTKNYSKQSSFDLEVKTFENNATILSVIDIMDQTVDLSNLNVSGQTVSLKSAYLKALPEGMNIFIVETNFGSHEIKINITNTSRPYMITGSEIHTNFANDVEVYYELFSGEVLSLSGNEITTSDYTITNNKVVIDKEYIKDQFDKVPNRTTLILGYTLQSGDNVVVGYIFIKTNR